MPSQPDSSEIRARTGAEALYRQVSGLGYVLLLTDQAGVTVDYMGDPASTEAEPC